MVVVVGQHGGLRVRPLLVGREVEVVVGEQEVAVAGSNGAGLKEKLKLKKKTSKNRVVNHARFRSMLRTHGELFMSINMSEYSPQAGGCSALPQKLS